MSRKPEIENPTRLNAYLPELTKATLVALKNRLGLGSVGATITRLATERGAKVRITEEELATAREELKNA